MFKILSPIASFDELQPLIDTWADEFYWWFIWKNWMSLNDRPATNKFNFETIDELKKTIDLAKKNWKKFNLVFNNTSISNEILSEYLTQISHLNPNSLIISNIWIIKHLNEIKFPIEVHLSTIVSVISFDYLKYINNLVWWKIKRVCIERWVWLKTLECFINTDIWIDIEFFVYSWFCRSVEWLCDFHFMLDSSKVQWWCTYSFSDVWSLKNIYSDFPWCAFCSLKYFFDKYKDFWKNFVLKIEWRWKNIEKKLKYIKWLKKCLDLIYSWKSSIQKIKKIYFEMNWEKCGINKSCYYPKWT